MRIKILGLLCVFALLGSAKASDVAGQTAPTMQDMLKWKVDFLSKYDDIDYLDDHAIHISEDVFLMRVVAEHRGFNMQTNSDAPKRITIRLLSDAEQRVAQAVLK